jgi:putative sporulation protein YtaF
MSLQIFSIALMSISSNTDSFAIAIACGIRKVRIPLLPNLLIATVSSFGTFLSMSLGQTIGQYLPRSISTILGSGVLISLGILGIFGAIWQERKRLRIEKYRRENYRKLRSIDSTQSSIQPLPERETYIDILSISPVNNSRYMTMKESIPLAFSLTINNVGGGVGAGIAKLNVLSTTGLTFVFAILAILIGCTLGQGFAKRMTEYWAHLLSSISIILIGIYEYFN